MKLEADRPARLVKTTGRRSKPCASYNPRRWQNLPRPATARKKPIGQVADEAFVKHQEERKKVVTAIKKNKSLVLKTLGYNLSREAWTIDQKDGKGFKRVLVKEVT